MTECNDILKSIHSVEIDILKKIDDFCRQNNIKYSLYCGTMLGAIRHKGFIPWDDDIDLCMERNDYDRFIELWTAGNNIDYILQNKDTDPDFSQSFTKIRKNNTAFVQQKDIGKSYHKGIFVDILPIDRIPNGVINRKIFKLSVMVYQLFVREFVPDNSSKYVRIISSLLLKIFTGKSRRFMYHFALKGVTKYKNQLNLALISANSMDGFSHIMPSSMPQRMAVYEFEGEPFMGYADFDGMLKAWYKDYMQLPPESERIWKHQPLYVSIQKNYQE